MVMLRKIIDDAKRSYWTMPKKLQTLGLKKVDDVFRKTKIVLEIDDDDFEESYFMMLRKING